MAAKHMRLASLRDWGRTLTGAALEPGPFSGNPAALIDALKADAKEARVVDYDFVPPEGAEIQQS